MHTSFALADRRVWVAGHRGMVGSALVRRLASESCEIITAGRDRLDLLDQAAVDRWMEQQRPDVVIVAAAKVGGILANDSRPAEFLYENLMIEANVVHSAHVNAVGKLLFLGSSCIYPRMATQPIPESELLAGPLEPTNEWYAIAKIAGVKLCQAYRRQYGADFISAMPTNLYGPGDNYDPNGSHVLPALLRRMHLAKLAGAPEVEVWGSGAPQREFLHVDDLADACVHLLKTYTGESHVNVGSGQEVTIRGLAELVADVVGYSGEVVFDPTKPDGTPRKLLDTSLMDGLGWRASIGLRRGIADTYASFLQSRPGA